MNRKHSSGFTLVEILVSIAVVSILISILLPAIGHARTRAWRLKSEANLRSIGQLFEINVNDSDGAYPAPEPGRFYYHGVGLSATMGHWQASDYWHALLVDHLHWEEHKDLLLSPGATRLEEGPVLPLPSSSYQYSSSFLGNPLIWSDGDNSSLSEAQWTQFRRPVRSHQIRSTSAKVLLWDRELGFVRRTLEVDDRSNLAEDVPMVFADGHVAGHRPTDAITGVWNQDPTAQYPIQNLHCTPQGVHGRDY